MAKDHLAFQNMPLKIIRRSSRSPAPEQKDPDLHRQKARPRCRSAADGPNARPEPNVRGHGADFIIDGRRGASIGGMNGRPAKGS